MVGNSTGFKCNVKGSVKFLPKTNKDLFINRIGGLQIY